MPCFWCHVSWSTCSIDIRCMQCFWSFGHSPKLLTHSVLHLSTLGYLDQTMGWFHGCNKELWCSWKQICCLAGFVCSSYPFWSIATSFLNISLKTTHTCLFAAHFAGQFKEHLFPLWIVLMLFRKNMICLWHESYIDLRLNPILK